MKPRSSAATITAHPSRYLTHVFRGDVVVVSASPSAASSSASSPASASGSHISIAPTAHTTALPLRLCSSVFAVYAVVSIASSRATAAANNSCSSVTDPSVSFRAASDVPVGDATPPCDAGSVVELIDFVVCPSTTRVVVTAASADDAADYQPRVFLPAWCRMWQGMAPVPVGLMARDAWAHVQRLSRAMRVTHVY